MIYYFHAWLWWYAWIRIVHHLACIYTFRPLLNYLSVRGDEGRRDNDDKRPIRTLSSCRQKMPGQFITFVRGTFVSCWVNKQNILPIVDFRSAVKLPYDHRSVANKVLWNRRGRRQHTGFPSQTTLIMISARGGWVSGMYICSLRTESLHSPKPYTCIVTVTYI